ncbi:MAG: ABC transporter ATP-binding protein [Flavobacteriales bacterium]|nr:ABC transporter ATP-binding protein [Flavobacteriales bacterium]
MIEVKDLYKKFGKNEVLKGLNLSIEKEGIFTILGPNGSGKTTLIKSILGMVLPDSGEIKINGENVKKQWNYRFDIDYMPQIANFPTNLDVDELFDMIIDLRGSEKRKDELIKLFGLGEFLKKKLGNLSGGTKQKVNIVLSFMFDSPIIILDEPTTGLDPVSLIRLKDLIMSEKDKGKTILITTHIMDFVEQISDQIVFILEGVIYFRGTVNELKTKTNQESIERAIASILTETYA